MCSNFHGAIRSYEIEKMEYFSNQYEALFSLKIVSDHPVLVSRTD